MVLLFLLIPAVVIVIIFYLRYVHAICNVVVVASAVELVVAPVVVGCS